MKLNLDYLLEQLWEYLSLIRVYTKKPGQPPDFEDSLILRRGVTVEHVCHAIHRTLAAAFKYALVWVSYEQRQISSVRFEVVMDVIMNSISFWDVTPHSLVEVYQCFTGTYFIYSACCILNDSLFNPED